MSEAVRKGVLLAETYEKVKPVPNPEGWWMSEKLDGVRAYWDGRHFYSRNNLKFEAPEWFKESLPTDSHLDGELWCGREQFERCVGIIKYHKGSTAVEWKHLCFLVFDAPVIKGDEGLPFEQRHAFVEQVAREAPYAAAVGIRKCQGQAHLTELLQAVCAHGAEGLMLRKQGSIYERVRSSTLLKVKTFMDAEAKIVGYTEGKHRLVGMVGALQCEMPLTGNRFEIGTGLKDAERNWTGAKKRWPVGTVLTYKYQNITAKGVPRFP
jgi:DNA ligase 1